VSRPPSDSSRAAFVRKVDELCVSAIDNQCTNLSGNGSGCEEYGHDVADWCGVCLLVHDIRKLVETEFTSATEEPKT